MSLAIILAGGTGSRIKSADIPKQYIEVGGKPVISYVLETVYSVKEITNLVVVSEASWRDEIFLLAISAADEVGRETIGLEVNFADPGENRQLSILNGLKALSEVAREDDLVAILDAARPNTSPELLSSVLAAAAACDGAIPVLPMKDTVYLSEDGKRISSLLPREQVFAGQAPEAFRYGKYLAANEALLPDRILEIHGSTEPAILAGMDIAVIPGDEGNFKITTDADLQRFRELVEKKA
ncbi:MAG: IspD/TarI family cytidylyltransferase [Lachnospiraceae bacterium]|nr:IspD/TarI family cytidylyltransferase [Lachnospiraceae bacterium]